jgi:hypothetical protein
MTVNRTTLLDLPLPVTGTESGTWGDTTNNGLTQYVDIAVAGMNSLTSANFTAGALTLANTTGDSSATNIAAGSAQYGAIKVSSLATNSTITAPSSNRRYTIINADATYSVTIKASGQTGVTIVAGEKALVAFNGTDYVKIATANGTGEFTTVDTTNLEVTNIKAKDGTAAATIADSTGVVTVTAAPVMTALTASQAVFTTAGKALTSNAITGTGNVVMSASPTLTGTISAAAATLSGNLTLSGGTANGVLYLDGSKVATSGSALTWNGANLATTGDVLLNNARYYYGKSSGGSNVRLLGINSGDVLYLGIDSGPISMIVNASSTSTNIAFNASGSEGMRLTSTGLGIGTSSPGTKLHVTGSNGLFVQFLNSANNTGEGIVFGSGTNLGRMSTNGASTAMAFEINAVEKARITSGGDFRVKGAGTAGSTEAFQVSGSAPADAARLDSSGNFLVGTTNSSTTVGVGVKTINSGTEPVVSIVSDTASASASAFILYNTNATNNGYRFYVQYNGGISNYQGNDANLSDRREKTNFAPAKSYLDTICAIPVQTFNYIGQSEDDPGLTLGVVAQDVQAVAPELVMESDWGTKEEPKMRLSIYQTDLQYALMKCIQELKSELDSVKAELATLKG